LDLAVATNITEIIVQSAIQAPQLDLWVACVGTVEKNPKGKEGGVKVDSARGSSIPGYANACRE